MMQLNPLKGPDPLLLHKRPTKTRDGHEGSTCAQSPPPWEGQSALQCLPHEERQEGTPHLPNKKGELKKTIAPYIKAPS